MDIFEITGNKTGVSKAGVNFLQPADSYQNLINGFIYRQVLQSRQGAGYFAPRLAGATRIMGIFEHILPDDTKQLLAFDTNFLYKYNTATGVFDQIAFGGSMAAYAGFVITDKSDYISGTSYPTATNTARFVFTGHGINPNAAGSAVFFYNGTDVQDFTSVVDNPNYAAPITGALNRANYVVWFGERINFIVPVIASSALKQGMLFSGIRTVSGNGDKFNVSGAGLLQLDTSEPITGQNILGPVLIFNADRSNWVIEKTRDPFNPYFSRKIPSVLGTNANFSAVAWNDKVKSIGKTGIIETDNRVSLKNDNKIPNFTADEIDQQDFNLTYGGFDRVNNQFLWAYKESKAQISGADIGFQNKVLVNNYEEDTWSVYDQRFSVFGQTDIGLNLTWNDIEAASGNVSWDQWDTTEEIFDKIGSGLDVQKTLAGDDLGFIYDINQDFDDYITSISAITQATSAVLTVAASAFKVGDLVVVQNVAGMTQINNFDPAAVNANFTPYTVITASATSITLNVDSTQFTAATPNTGRLSKVISFSAETIPFNPYRDQGMRCFVSHVEFLIDTGHASTGSLTSGGILKVDVYADEEESPFKENVLCLTSSTTTKAREWITMTVDNEANFHTFVMKQQSPAVQLRITSMRIHCAPAGYTSG